MRENVQDALADLDDVGTVTVASGQGGFASSDIEVDVTAPSADALQTATDAVVAGSISDIPVTYNIWDLTRLHRVETTGSKEKIVVKFADDFGGGLPALRASGPESELPSYLAVIRGKQLADIYDKWGARLLESNIRSFIQARRKSVNEGIRDTIKGEPEMFFSYNNGLSATADAVDTEMDGAGDAGQHVGRADDEGVAVKLAGGDRAGHGVPGKVRRRAEVRRQGQRVVPLSLIHLSEPTLPY